MGFSNFLGEIAGKLVAQAQEALKYKTEYEWMSNEDLIAEYRALKASLVPSMAAAAVAAGTDGIMIEVHNDPAHALCDGAQSLNPDQFDNMCCRIRKIQEALA